MGHICSMWCAYFSCNYFSVCWMLNTPLHTDSDDKCASHIFFARSFTKCPNYLTQTIMPGDTLDICDISNTSFIYECTGDFSLRHHSHSLLIWPYDIFTSAISYWSCDSVNYLLIKIIYVFTSFQRRKILKSRTKWFYCWKNHRKSNNTNNDGFDVHMKNNNTWHSHCMQKQ